MHPAVRPVAELLAEKIAVGEQALLIASGVAVDVFVDQAELVPGEPVKLSIALWNAGPNAVKPLGLCSHQRHGCEAVALRAPAGLKVLDAIASRCLGSAAGRSPRSATIEAMKLSATLVLLLVASAQSTFGQLLPANVGLIRDINPATTSDLGAESITRLEESLADWVPFWTAPGSQDAGLWATDGTTAGTRLITDLMQLEYANWDFGLCFSGQTWYFWNTDSDGTALWRTDGTAATTELVARWPPDYSFLTPFWYDSKFCSRRSAGGKILFWLERQLDMSNFRVELWSTDGTTQGTHFVRDLGLDTYYHNAVLTFAQHGEKVEFSLQVADNGYGLWESDGTAAGTVEIGEDAAPEAPGLLAELYLVANGERTYFRSWASSILDGHVFGYTDGTPLGTHFFPDRRLQDYYLYTPGFAFIGDRLTFPSGTPEGWAIYSIGSTETAPSPVMSYPAGSDIRAFSWTEDFAIEGRAVYLASVPVTPSPDVSYETRLVATAGTVETTEEIATFCAGGVENCELLPVGRAGAALVFLERTPTECNLWRTDGTSAGTVEVRTLGTFCTSYLFAPVSAGSRVYFFADGLWASDGTDSGTERIVSPELLNGSAQFEHGAAPLANGDLVFALNTVNSGAEPWISDGTAAGTGRLADLARDRRLVLSAAALRWRRQRRDVCERRRARARTVDERRVGRRNDSDCRCGRRRSRLREQHPRLSREPLARDAPQTPRCRLRVST